MKGRISDSDINTVRERTNIVDIVSSYVTLKKKGKLFWGVCPFHTEKTPSFKIDPATQLFHCFGCGEGGNVFTFIMKIEHLEFPEAVEMLAEKIGYTIQYEDKRGPATSKKTRIIEANSQAMRYYQFILLKAAQGEAGRKYAKSRQLTQEIVKKYSVGLAPKSWDALFKYLTKKGFSKELLLEAGLALQGKKGVYDRFRDRLIFPITDLQGRVIAFGGRIISQGEPKYLNSPETPVYHKSSTLYGLHMAKNAMVREGYVIVVEGYTDVLALAQAGIENVVATLGTAFTADHVGILRRFTDRVVLVFDADAAGVKAAESVGTFISEFRLPRMESLQKLETEAVSGLDVRVVVLPNKQDPAEFVLSHSVRQDLKHASERNTDPNSKNGTQHNSNQSLQIGAEAFKRLVGSAEPFFDFYLTREIDKYNISEVRQKERAAIAGLKFIATLDPLLRGAYLGKIADKLGIDKDALEIKFRSIQRNTDYARSNSRSNSGGDPVRREARAATISPQEKVERSFLQLLLRYPENITKILDDINEDHFSNPAHVRLFTVLKDMGGGKFDASVLDSFDADLKTKATELLMSGIECEEENLSKYFKEYLTYLKDFYCKRQINKIKQELQDSKAQTDHEYYDALFEKLIAIEAKRRDLRKEGIVG
jgi:DNA primase